MKIDNLKTIAILIAAQITFSCTDDKDNNPKDTTKPTITVISGTPEFHYHDGVYEAKAKTGSTFGFELKLEDNQELSQVKVEIHDAEDGHTHRLALAKWYLDSSYSVSGKVVNWSKSYTIPTNIWTGPYHVIIKLLDKAGNESDITEIDLKIVSKDAPELSNITTSATNGKIVPGQLITVTGVVTDATNLGGGEIEIHLEGPGDREFDHVDIEIPDDATSPYTFTGVVRVPSNAPKGKYHLHIEAKDKDDNVGEEEIELELD
jgi:uncharacterized membrane protein